MSHYTGTVPDTHARPADWLMQAACKDEPEAMFRTGYEADIEYAKAICCRCTVVGRCLQWALDSNEAYGVWGGLSEKERRALKRRLARGRDAAPPQQKQPEQPAQPAQPAPKTLAEAFARRTQRTDSGHLLWCGAQHLQFKGRKYTALQVAFAVGHGRDPEGLVRRTCGTECYHSAHLTDAVIRDSQVSCGTRAGYLRHRKRGEDACAGCKRANTAADNRLRRIGTTKAVT